MSGKNSNWKKKEELNLSKKFNNNRKSFKILSQVSIYKMNNRIKII